MPLTIWPAEEEEGMKALASQSVVDRLESSKLRVHLPKTLKENEGGHNGGRKGN
jgi:hypothetical protein